MDIKKCPFCGGAWLYVSDGDYYSDYESKGYRVNCKCGYAWKAISWKKTREQAIEAWNRKLKMDERIEEMVLAIHPWLKEVPVEERKPLRENVSGLMAMEKLYNAGYRKESDTAREILDEVSKHYGGSWLVELYKKYGVDLGRENE